MSLSDPIDIVLPWVDGNDPEHRRKRFIAMGGDATLAEDEIGGETRYSNLGELQWCIASINRFMPWIHRIFIVTDNQDPSRELRLTKANFPSPVPVEVVDHSVIFRGYEDVMPVFNCNSIDSSLWRIPGLSRKYLYFNDDTFVLAPMSPEDWYDGDNLICHGHHIPLFVAEIGERMRRGKGGKHVQGFKTPIISAAKILNSRHIVYYYHHPLAQDRCLLEDFYSTRPELLRTNALPKFREPQQFSGHSLCNLLAEKAGRLKLVRRNTNLFLKPLASRPDYLTKRLAKADSPAGAHLRMGCISSLDRASDAQRAEFEKWIMRRLNLNPITDCSE